VDFTIYLNLVRFFQNLESIVENLFSQVNRFPRNFDAKMRQKFRGKSIFPGKKLLLKDRKISRFYNIQSFKNFLKSAFLYSK
jgi:hypothetical protein